MFWSFTKRLVFLSIFSAPIMAFESADKGEEALDILSLLGIPLVQPFHDDASANSYLKEDSRKYQEQSYKGHKGLRNYGNTCYINAVTYLIANTSLHRLVTENREGYEKEAARSNLKLRNALKKLLKSMKSNAEDSHHQLILRNYLKELNTALKGGLGGSIYMQQDAAEFLDLLLQALGAHESEFEMIQREQITYADDRDAIIYDNPYKILRLPIEGHSVNDLAENYFSRETFKTSEQDEPLIEKYRQVGLVKAPKTLLVQLKRFKPFIKIRSWVSLDRYVSLPIYSPTVAGLSKQIDDETYRLKALVVHQGNSVKFGHYVSYEIKYRKSGTYLIKYDDEHISRVPMSYLGSLLTKDAYLLAYERKN